MQPIVTPEEMGAVDAAAPEPVEELVRRAGAAVARAAVDLLDGAYGRRVVVVAGKGNNGADGLDAARRLRARGAAVVVVPADEVVAGARLPGADLVVDAAYGTGLRGGWGAPDPGGAPVLAVDIPSGVSGLTGEAGPGAVRADRTVTFAAWKPGLLLHPGRGLAGATVVADIGLDVSGATAHVVEPADVARWLPRRPSVTHKWQAAVWVVGGSSGMTGAPVLAASAAARAGAGYVRVSAPGVDPPLPGAPVELVGVPLPATGWAEEVVDGAGRFSALVVGPGLGPGHGDEVRALLAGVDAPVVADGDALRALGEGWRARPGSTVVLTPHDGEHEALAGAAVPADRFAAARRLATATGATVLLKGPTTVVADPGGAVLVSTAGDARLATAGTGDVLSGTIAALLARGVAPLRAAAGGALLHGLAASFGPADGLVATDVVDHLPDALAALPRTAR